MKAAAHVLLVMLLGGCASDASPDSGNVETGGASAQGGGAGAMNTGGVVSTGGMSSGGSPTGGSPATSGGTSPGGGASGGGASGGTSSGGAATGGIPASGGASGGTGGGQSSTGGQGGSSAEASAGCGKQGRPANGTVTVANDHIYSFPASYDGSKPMPLFIGFHACNNPIDQFLNLTNGSKIESEYVRAFPRSTDSGGCWDYGTDIARVTRVYDELMSSYCIDKARVFAAGHSSGAQMIVQILTHANDAAHLHFTAVSPVAASDYGPLAGPEPVLYIQGKMDNVRKNDGAGTVNRFRMANGCSATSKPYSSVMSCQSSGKTVSPGCIAYDGCQVPTLWCSHDDPQYNGTSHGVPCFAITAMHDFFSGVR